MKTRSGSLYLVILAGVLWILTELMSLMGAGISTFYLMLGAVASLALGFSFWVLHKAQRGKRGVFTFMGSLSALAGLVLLTVLIVPTILSPGQTDPLTASPIYLIGYVMYVFGALIFSVGVLKSRSYPPWTGVILLVATAMSFTLMMAQIYSSATNLIQIAAAVALVGMAWSRLESRAHITIS